MSTLLKKMMHHPLPIITINCQRSLPSAWWDTEGPILHSSCAGKHGCCEFRQGLILSDPEDSFSQGFSPSSCSYILYAFSSLMFSEGWYLLIYWRVENYSFSQLLKKICYFSIWSLANSHFLHFQFFLKIILISFMFIRCVYEGAHVEVRG